MLTTLTVNCDPERTWKQQALVSLENALGHALNLWTYRQSSDWVLEIIEKEENVATSPDASSNVHEQDPSVLELVERAANDEKTITRELTSGNHLLVIPFDQSTVATTIVTTDRPELLVGVADVSMRFFTQQEEMTRLREENGFFLKQVSDDFEELTFLRSMAERLGLGDSTHTIEQLVTASLPDLGKSTHAEQLYYLDNSSDELKILGSWSADDGNSKSLDSTTVLELMRRYRTQASCRAIIKNSIHKTELKSALPGVRDFILVPVAGVDEPLGWFLAVNHLAEEKKTTRKFPEWRLSQLEFGTNEASLLTTAAAMTASHANNLSLFQERESLLVSVVRSLVSAVEAKDQYTCGHSERVALYARRLAEKMGYDQETCELLYLTGLLHDVGKIAINDAILNKPGRLTDEEFAEIQRHPEEGWKILHELKQLSYVLPGVLHHHERFDGKGYPDGLAGSDIPWDGRILAVADAYDAMTSDRAYRTGMPHEKAVGILRDGAGTQWDPDAINAFLEITPDMVAIHKSYQPREKESRTPAIGSVSYN